MSAEPKFLSYTETPIIPIHSTLLESAKVRLFVKREDLNHETVSGNKWWKLKNNLQEALRLKFDRILTYGGAFSNHIYASAAATHELGIQSVGIIRGEPVSPLNPILHFASGHGMKLHYLSRADYRKKEDAAEVDKLVSLVGSFYLMPEGGTNELAITGVEEFASQLPKDFDFICCPVGTGGTLTGLVRGLRGQSKALGFTVLKGGESWIDEVNALRPGYSNWALINDYHFGGYAKTSSVLSDFMDQFTTTHHVPLEHVYSGKMFYGIFDLLQKGFFRPGCSILALHTGGIHRH
ncbi:MAG TPA: pyridoxal-phosphate dependent enzyme [Chryseolinea sp.]|nr:pyridoxal-phosphate dependent enzyme [Chryseolinea sp.]